MKLIIQNDRIAGTATDGYAGPDAFIVAPDGFDHARVNEYVIVDGIPVIPQPSMEEQWAIVRDERNRRLTACDWTQLPDAPVNAADWASYRQALRDITTQSDPFNIQWPIEPGA